MKWLQVLLENIANFPEDRIQEPDAFVEEGEKVIGVVPPELRKMYGYLSETATKADALMQSHQMEHVDSHHTLEMCDESKGAYAIMKAEVEVLQKAFFMDLTRAFKKSFADHIGVRKGWKVVESSPVQILERYFSRALSSIMAR